jgi:hypothetical protein
MVRDDSSGVEQHEGKRMVVRRREESSLKLLAISEAASVSVCAFLSQHEVIFMVISFV